jgi:hypothetical protein
MSFIGNVTRSPKKRSDGGACEGPQCIVDPVYDIVERTYGFNVDAPNPNNGCFVSDKACVEDSGYNLCESFEDEEEDVHEDTEGDEDDKAQDESLQEGQSVDE